MRQFITNMLNIQEDKIEELQTIVHSDGSIIINLKLNVTSKICPFCSRPVKFMVTTQELLHTLHWSTINAALFIAKEDSSAQNVLILLTNIIPLLKPMTD